MSKLSRVFLGAILSIGGTAFAQAPATAPATGPANEVRQAWIQSLTIRPERFIADSTHSAIIWLNQTAAIQYTPSALKLKLSLYNAEPGKDDKPLKELGTSDVYPRDFLSRPFAVSANLLGIPDGSYTITGTLMEGDTTIATLSKPILLVAGIDAKQGEVEQRLAKIQGHDSTKATIRYPLDFARVLNIGKRNWDATDLGIDQQSKPNYYDFTAAMKRSDELLASLEKGTDPLWQAKGEVERHYWMEESGEIQPYRIYVPSTWDGKTPLPMVFILHGNSRNQGFYFERDGKIIPQTAEKHGFMLVGCFGYNPQPGSYNIAMLRGGPHPMGTPPVTSGAAPVAAGRGGRGAPGGARGGNPSMNGMPQNLIGAMAEADTRHVLELVRKEYPIDPKRTWLFGYSAGGNGGYWIASNYANDWAAVAIGGALTGPAQVAPYFERFKSLNIPFFIYYGEQDTTVQNGSKQMVQAMKEAGIDATLKMYPGATHDSAPSAGVADAFDFFAAHPRK